MERWWDESGLSSAIGGGLKAGVPQLESLPPEKMELSSGMTTKRMMMGRRFSKAFPAVCCSSCRPPAPAGRLRGRFPPNWCTRMPPGPEKTKLDPPRGLPMPKGPPPPPPKAPMPPPKNCRKRSSGEISSSNMEPPPPPPPAPGGKPNPPPAGAPRANAEKGDAPADAPLDAKRLSGSPPNWSYRFLLSGSDSIWNARLTILNASSAPLYPFLSGCVSKLCLR